MDRKAVEQFRLALFGRMVMGVSHEVDNHLSVVLGFAELIQVTGAAEKKALDGAGKILLAGERMAALIKQFSHYVRPHTPLAEPFLVSNVLREVLLFARYDLERGNVVLRLPESAPACWLRGDERDFALALLAVLLNGAEAMTGKGGTLALDGAVREGGLHLAVADEGPGIADAVMPRIFEEGFTTKSAPVHSGMGLPVARHVVAGLGGDIVAANRGTRGCVVTMRLPVSGAQGKP